MSRIRARRAEPRRRLAPQENADWWTWATLELLGRCGHRCEKCGHPLGDQMERHHRQKRTIGGDRLANLLALHSACHAWIHAHPKEAREAGWIVSIAAADPALVPVRLPGGDYWLLDDGGHRTPAA